MRLMALLAAVPARSAGHASSPSPARPAPACARPDARRPGVPLAGGMGSRRRGRMHAGGVGHAAVTRWSGHFSIVASGGRGGALRAARHRAGRDRPGDASASHFGPEPGGQRGGGPAHDAPGGDRRALLPRCSRTLWRGRSRDASCTHARATGWACCWSPPPTPIARRSRSRSVRRASRRRGARAHGLTQSAAGTRTG